MSTGFTKVILLGPSGVGKSTLVERLRGEHPRGFIGNTVGCAFARITINTTKFDVWDTAGQERYMPMYPLYSRRANIILLVFDVSDIQSLDRLAEYFEYYLATRSNDTDPKYIFIGNKLDRVDPGEIEPIRNQVITKIVQPHQLETTSWILFASALKDPTIIPIQEALLKYVAIPSPPVHIKSLQIQPDPEPQYSWHNLYGYCSLT